MKIPWITVVMNQVRCGFFLDRCAEMCFEQEKMLFTEGARSGAPYFLEIWQLTLLPFSRERYYGANTAH
jgi:hypothetical protein